MAKISARGATEVARLRVKTPTGLEKIYVLTSDKRILTRYVGDAGTGYTIRLTSRQFRQTHWTTGNPHAVLRAIAIHDGYNVI